MGRRSLFQPAFPLVPSSLISFAQFRRRLPALIPALVPALAPAALLALSLATAAAQAQQASIAQNTAPAGPATQPAAAAAGPSDDNAWLATTGKLYYSTTRAGLSGFDCAVHPDWRALFMTSRPGTTVADDDPHVVLLKSVKINLHAHMKGGSTLDWSQDPSPDKPLDQASTEMLDKMHQATEQTIEGFMQFWTPFMDGSVLPDSSDGLTITHTGTMHTIHVEQGDMALTEIFSNDLRLEHFNVDMKTVSIKFQPAYQPTDQGLLVKSFDAHVQPAGAADQSQDMHVEIEYQTLEGFPIPSKLNMEIVNSGTFSFVLDGCTVRQQQITPPAVSVKPALK
jgi:hypothetical protein